MKCDPLAPQTPATQGRHLMVDEQHVRRFTQVSASTIYDPSWRSHKLFLEAHPVWRFRVNFDVNLHEAITPHGQFDLRRWGEE